MTAIASGLPELCYSRLLTDDSCIIIKRGESGYNATDYPLGYTDEVIDKMNTRLGVTPAQRMAMEIGSMMGWDVPGADPERHVQRMVAIGRMPG